MAGSLDMGPESHFLFGWAKALCAASIGNALPLLVALALVGCRLPSQEGLKNSSWDPPPTAEEQAGAPQARQGLIKPVIPLERQTDAPSPPQKGEQPQPPIRVVLEPPADSKPQKNDWEDDKVKRAAIELAKAFPSVRKMKICLEVKHSEWWVILYEDNGPMVELRQFVWNKSEEKFEPHLVPDRIPRDQLDRHAAESEPGRACETVDLGTRP